MPPADVPSLLCAFAFFFFFFRPAVSSGSTPAKGEASSSPSIMKYMAPKLLASTQRAVDRRFVLCSAINLRPESMRYDDGYKLFLGTLNPAYVETTMYPASFNSILANLYAETCDEVKKGIRVHWESCRDLWYEDPFLGAQLDLTTVTNEEYITFSVSYVAQGEGRVLYAPVQNRHNTGKSEAVVAYNTDQSLGSLGCF